jgi:hypothetical protein
MAVRYVFRVDPPFTDEHRRNTGAGELRADGAEVVRKVVIPESPDEELRGETYEQDVIDWHHNSELEHITNRLPDGHTLTGIWTERTTDGTVVHRVELEGAGG